MTNWFEAQKQLYAFPGITPEMIIVLDGQLTYNYLGQQVTTNESSLFGFLHGDIFLDFSALRSFVVVVFQPRALASVLPFLQVSAKEFIQQPIQPLANLYPDFDRIFIKHLRNCSPTELGASLDTWLLRHYQPARSGFITDLAQEMPPNYALKSLREITNYSVSTLERYFKQDTGLRPKQYQRLHRFRGVIEYLYTNQHPDWGACADTFGFFDQSHLIKEIRSFTGFTPSQLLKTPGIFPFRPK